MKFRNPLSKNHISRIIEAGNAPSDRIMNLIAPVDIAAAQGGEPDPGRTRPFSMVAYTGGIMRIAGWYTPVIIDLQGLVFSAPMTMLGNHNSDPDWVAGTATKIEVIDNQLLIAGEIFGTGTTPMAEKIVRLSEAGMKWQASVGVEAVTVESVQPGKKAEANGQTFTGPVLIARKSNLRETSFVVIGADEKTSANIAASMTPENKTGEIQMDAKLKLWIEAKGFNPETVEADAVQLAFLTAAWTAEVEAATKKLEKPGDGGDDIKAQMDAMRREHALDRICGAEFADIRAKAETEKLSVDAVKVMIDAAKEKKLLEAGYTMPNIRTHGSDGPNPVSVMEAAMCLSSGFTEEETGKGFDEKTMNAALARDFRGFGLSDLMFASIAASGQSVRAGSITDDVIRAAFNADRRQIEAGFSTLGFTSILSNVANKRLLQSYRAIDSAIDKIAAARDVPDFKQVTSYGFTADGNFTEVGPDGELKSIGLQDTPYTNQAKTEGAIISLTRTMMINDDLGAFLRIPSLLGRQAALAKERAGFKALLDNTGSFFHADNANYGSGADTVLGVVGLTTAVAQVMNQTDPNGDPVMVTPTILLVPPALAITAKQLFSDLTVNETTTANKPKLTSNPHAGSYTPVVSPFLSNTTFHASASATAWYLFANPADVAALEIVYLRGMRTPTIERGELSFDKLGAAFRGYFDFGVNLSDFRAANLQAGA